MKVGQDVLKVLSLCKLNGNKIVLTGQLERSLYVKTNKVLEAAGGKWNRKDKAHIFNSDAIDAITKYYSQEKLPLLKN